MASRAAAEKIAIGGLKFALSQGVLVAIASYIARWHRLAQQARFRRVSRGVQHFFVARMARTPPRHSPDEAAVRVAGGDRRWGKMG